MIKRWSGHELYRTTTDGPGGFHSNIVTSDCAFPLVNGKRNRTKQMFILITIMKRNLNIYDSVRLS